MTVEQRISKMNISMKLKFFISWLFYPTGINLKDTVKVINFKLFHLFKIFWYILNGNDISSAIKKAKTDFLQNKINVVVKSKDGLLFHIMDGDALEKIQEYREDFVDDHFRPQNNDVVVDIGAHIGIYTLKASRLLSDKGKVFAIEPDPITFLRLKENVQLNKATNVTPINVAIFSENKKVKLYQSKFSSANSIKFEVGTDYVEVDASTLDQIMEKYGHDRVEWIKVDVEGAEKEVLDGASKLLSQNNTLKVILEIHSQDVISDIEKILHKNNFTLTYHRYTDSKISYILAERLILS